jgi:hypothetical protein
MSTHQQPPRSPANRLAQHGWKPSRSRWRRHTSFGCAQAWCADVTSGWEAWLFQGGALPCPAGADLLKSNAQIAAPCKLVRSTDGVVTRADVPVELTGEAADHPLDAWARAITAAAAGEWDGLDGDGLDEPGTPLAAPELVAWLEKTGWAASLADDVVRVSVQLPGAFREIVLESGRAALRLWVELVDWTDWPAPSRRAATELALQANDRLYLARFSVAADSSGGRLIAEVYVPQAPMPGPWLELGLETTWAAVALTARELVALRDPELASLTLAGGV